MRILIFFAVFVALTLTSCGEKKAAEASDGFDSAYPAMYTELGLPQYRRGRLQNVNGKDEGVKTVHTFTVISKDTPSYVRDFFVPAMKELGWKDLKARRKLSDMHEDDLYFANYVKGKNKLEISSSAEGSGGSKTRISLAVFNSN